MSDPLQHGENAPPPPDPPATSPNPENPPEGGGEEKPMNRFAERRRTLISRTAVRGSDGKANLQLLASGFAKPKPKEDNPETPVDAAADGGESNGAKSADDVIVKTTTPTPAVDPALPPQTPDPKQQQKQPAALPHSSTPEGKTDSTHSTPILVDPSLPQHISQTSITTTITTETIHTTTPPPPTNPNSNITRHSPTGTTRFVDDNNNPLSPQPANQGSTNPNNNNNNNNTKQNKNNDDILHQSYTTPSELVMSPSTSDLFLIHNNINSPSNGYAEVIVKHNPPSQNPTPAPLPEPLGQSPQKSQRPNNNTTTPHPTTPGGGPPTHQKRASIVDRLFRRSSVTKNEASTTTTTPTDHPTTPHAQLPPQQQPHQQQSTTPQAGHRSFLTRRFSQDDTAVDFSKTNNNNNNNNNTNNNPNNTNHNSNNNNTAAGNINLPPCNASHQKDLPSGSSGGGGGVTASPTLLKNLQYDCVDSDDDELVLITRQDSAFAALKLRSSGANGIPPGLFCENEDDDNDDDHQTDASDAEKECIVRKAPPRGAGSDINKPTVPPHCTPTHEGKRLEASGDNNNQTNINTQHNNTTGNIYNNTCNQPATALSGKFPPLTISKAHSVDYDQDDVLTPLSRVNTSRVSSNNGTTNPTNRYTFSPLQKPETNPHTTLPPLATPTISSAAITNPDSTNGAAIGGDSSQNPTPPSPTASTTSLRMRRQALMGQKRTFQFMSPAQAPPPQATTTTTTTTINPPTTSLNTPQRPAHSPATTTTTLNTTIESSVSSTSPRHATTALSVGQSDTANTPIKPNNTTNNNNTPATVDDDGEIHFVRPTTPLILQSPGPLKIDNTTADSDCHTPPATTRAYDPNNDPHAVPTPPQQPQQSGQSSLESLKQFLDQKGKFYSLISPTTVQRTPTAKQFLPSDLTPAAGTPGTTRPFSFDDKTNGNDSTLDDDGDMVVKKPSANKAKRSKEDETDESDTELLRMPPETQDNTDLNKGDCELTETIRNALQLKRMYNIKRQTFCRCFQPQIVETTTTPTTEEGKQQQQCRYDIKYYTDHHPLPQYLTQNTIRAYCDELKALWDKCGLCDLPVQYTKHPYYIYLQKLNKELTTQQQQEQQQQQQKITNTTTSPPALNDDEYYSAIHHVELAHDDDDNDLVHKLMQMHTIYTSEPFYGTPYDNIGKYDDEHVDVFYYKPSSSLSSANASDNNDKQQQQQQQQQPKKDTAHLFYSSPTLIDDAILALHRKRPKKSVLFDHIEQQEQLSTVAEEEKRKHDKNNKKMSSSRSLSFDNNIATKLVIPRLLLSFPRLPLDKAHGADVDNHYHTYRNAGEQQQPQQQNQQQQDQQQQQQEQEEEEDEEIEYDTNYNPYHHDIIVDVDENASSSTNNTNDTTNSLDTTNINQTTPPQQQQRLMGQQPDLQPYDPFQPPVPTPVATNSPSTGSNGTQHTLPQTLLSPPPRGSNFDRVMSFQIVDIVDGNSPAVVGTDHFMHNNPSGSGSHSRYHSNNNGDGTNNNNKEMPSPLLATISKNAAVFKQ